MRKYTSFTRLGNRLPINPVIYVLSDYGNVFPTKDITLNYYKELDDIWIRAPEVARRLQSSIVVNIFFSFQERHSILYYLPVNYL